ncbi:MAG: hypothetical protein LH477_02355 [Nocardioides sp.]|nr:hypothetical protein [Nocardioides sp.]
MLQEGLEPWIARAQESGRVRDDLTAQRLTTWILLVLDGFLGRLATDDSFTVAAERSMLEDTVARLLGRN